MCDGYMYPHRPQTSLSPRQLIPVALLVIAAMLSAVAWAREDAAASRGETPPIALSADQVRAISVLVGERPRHPAPLFLFTDPNKDPDDLSVLVLTSVLQGQGFVDLRAVLTTLGDRQTRTRRARFAKDVLEDLGLQDVQVGVGVDYRFEVKDANGRVDLKATEGRRKDHQVFIDSPLGQPHGAVSADGLALLEAELARVSDHSAVLLVDAGMSDLAALLRDAPELVRKKTAKAVIMGGVEPRVDARGFVSADARAYNNTTDQPAADYAYARLQELGVPLVVVTKEAAYAAAASRGFYEGMAATGNPIGVYLRDQQKASLEKLWTGIRQGHLPRALTPAWFFETFTDVDVESPAGKAALGSAETNTGDFESVWQQVSKFNLYDPLALLAATPGVGERLFSANTLAGARGDVQVIDEGSIKDPSAIRDLLSGMAIEALSR